MKYRKTIASLAVSALLSGMIPPHSAHADPSSYIGIGPPRIIYNDQGHGWTLPPAWNPANGPNVFITTDQDDLNHALIEGIRHGDPRYLSEAFKKIAEGAQAGGSGTVYNAQQKQALYALVSSSDLSGTAMAIPFSLRPTPLPSGVSQTEMDQLLDPLWSAVEAVRQDMVATVDQVNAVLSQVAKRERVSGPGSARAHDEADYLRGELQRAFVDSDGIVRDLPYAHVPKLTLVSDPSSIPGVSVRSGLNSVLAAESIVGAGCAAAAADLRSACSSYASYSDTLKIGYALADRLASEGDRAQYEHLMESLGAGTAAVRGFAKGLLQGTLTLGAGLAAAAFLPEAVVLSALAYGVYEALGTLVEAQESIGEFAGRKWQEFVDASVERQGEMAGELTATVAGLYYGGEVTGIMKSTFEQGVRMAVTSSAVGLATAAAVAGGRLSIVESRAIQALAEAYPIEAAAMVKGGGLATIESTVPSLSKEAVEGLKILDRYSWLDVKQGLLLHTEDTLKLGQEAHERLSFGTLVSESSVSEALAELKAIKASYAPASPQSLTKLQAEVSTLEVNSEGKRIALWSGGIQAQSAALTWVREDAAHRTMLELTPGGKYLESLNLFNLKAGISEENATQLFSSLSKRFVESSRGEVNIFLSKFGIEKKRSVLKITEIPTVFNMPNQPQVIVYTVVP
jgi:hypothetical protein